MCAPSQLVMFTFTFNFESVVMAVIIVFVGKFIGDFGGWVLDWGLWGLTSLPFIGRFVWRAQWTDQSARYLTVQDHVDDFVRIKIKIKNNNLLSSNEEISDDVTIFAESADLNGVIGAAGHRYKLVKQFHNGPAPNWPVVQFIPVPRIT